MSAKLILFSHAGRWERDAKRKREKGVKITLKVNLDVGVQEGSCEKQCISECHSHQRL